MDHRAELSADDLYGAIFLPQDLESRITFPDVIHGLEKQTEGLWKASDFSPLPCAHPNGHSLGYAYRRRTKDGVEVLPLARFINFKEHLDLLAGRITFDRSRTKQLLEEYLQSSACGNLPMRSITPTEQSERHEIDPSLDLQTEFLQKALTQTLAPEDMLRITTTSFMDAYNFDVRQLMKSCVHHLLPSGHIIPFSAYNVLYRDGHVALPDLMHRELVSLKPS